MTRYWPLSIVRKSELIAPPYQWELAQFYKVLPSEGAYYACMEAAKQLPAADLGSLVVVETVSSSSRFLYTKRPTYAQWKRLERAAVVEGMEGFMCMAMDALH